MGLSAPSLYRRRASAADQAFLRRQHSVWGCGHANRLQGIPCCATPAHAKRRTCEDPACTPCDVVLTRFLAPPCITEEALLAETLLRLTSIRIKTCGESNASRKTLGARPAANGRQDANICWKNDDKPRAVAPPARLWDNGETRWLRQTAHKHFGRLAQRERNCLTSSGSGVQIPHRPPQKRRPAVPSDCRPVSFPE